MKYLFAGVILMLCGGVALRHAVIRQKQLMNEWLIDKHNVIGNGYESSMFAGPSLWKNSPDAVICYIIGGGSFVTGFIVTLYALFG